MSLYKSKIFSRLVAMLVLLMAGWAPQAAVAALTTFEFTDFSKQFSMDGEMTETGNIQPVLSAITSDAEVEIYFDQGDAVTLPGFFVNDNGFRIYAGSSFSVTSLNGPLEKITFSQWYSSKFVNEETFSCDCGGLSFDSKTGLVIWESYGEAGETVNFYVNNVRGNQFRFNAMSVTRDVETSVTPGPGTENDIYSIEFDNTDNWSDVYVYAWIMNGDGTETEFLGGWRGMSIAPTDIVNGIVRYSFDLAVPATGGTPMIIFSGVTELGEVQTSDLLMINGGRYNCSGIAGGGEDPSAMEYTLYFDYNDNPWSAYSIGIYDYNTGEYLQYDPVEEVYDSLNNRSLLKFVFSTSTPIKSFVVTFICDGSQLFSMETFVNNGVYSSEGPQYVFGEKYVEKLKTPWFSSSSKSFTEAFTVTISHDNGSGYQVYYTLDGTDPDTKNGTLYDGNPITIPEGNNVTLKAIVVNSTGDASKIATAEYTYVPSKTLTVKINKAGAAIFEIDSSDLWGSYSNFTEQTFRIPAGQQFSFYLSMKSGYECRGVSFNGTPVAFDKGRVSGYLTMSDEDAVLEIETAYNPTSPSDPAGSDAEPTYTLTVMYNPAGAGSSTVIKNLKAGEEVYLSNYLNRHSNYKFESFTLNGEMIPVNPEGGSYSIVMPAADVVVFANYSYCPASPDDPAQPELKRPVAAVAVPAGGCSFYIYNSSVAVGSTWSVSASPRTGYVFKGWILNGVRQENTYTSISGIMTEQGVSLVALCEYNPTSPGNPGSNYYNDMTGQLIVDDFTPGNLYDAVNNVLDGKAFDAVVSIIVKGQVTSSDYRSLRYMSTLQAADLSRTYGVSAFPGNVVAGLPVTSVILPSDITTVNYSAFNGCSNLVSLSLHSTVPPTVSGSSLTGFTPGNCVLRVPEESIELYKAAPVWKDFADIVPLGDAVHVLEVQLPYAYRDGRLKNNRIELVNIASGRRQRYVITERPIYTFNGVMKDEQYMVLMISESGLEMARISDVLIPDADHAVAFTTIKEMCDVDASVKSPEGDDVTDKCVVEWYEVAKDEARTYLRKARSLGKVPEGQNLVCKVTVDRDLAMKYQNPEELVFTVEPGMQPVEFSLEPLRTVIATGKVVDEEGNVPAGATVSVRQKIAGKYDRTASASVDKDGSWTSVMYDAPLTTVTYNATESLTRTDTVSPDMTTTLFDLGEVVMRSNVGARISYALSYLKSARKGETAEAADYQDIDNVNFKVYNVARKIQHPVTVQRGVILVLDQSILPTDSLTVSVSSTNDDFLAAEQTVEAGESLRPSVKFDLIGKGGVYASYGSTDSPAVVGMIYDAAGKYVKRGNFSNSSLTLGSLDDGDYSLVAMTKSDILNSAASLAALDELGLVRDKDYVMRKVRVSHGVISDVEFKTVPSVDESLFTFTSSNTSITPNKTNITTGQYLTIKTILDFKPVYKGRIDNVVMEFEIPERCDFVDASMMKGSKKFGYDVKGNRIVVDCGKNYAEQLRFCVMPNSAGEIGVVGRVTFDLDGQRLSQPIGTATAISRSFEFTAPVRTCYNQIVVSGAANPNSSVRIYQDGKLIGEGQSSQGGNWTVNCEMVDTYHQSEHQLQAIVTTPEGIELKSGTRRITFDGNAIMIDRVTMLTGNEEVVFDFNGVNNTQSYTWVDDRLFTFIVKLSDNAPEKISDVILYVKQLDGETTYYNCYYSESRDAWLCVGNFTSATAPINVAVSIINAEGLVFDREHFDSQYAEKAVKIADGIQKQNELAAMKAANAECLVKAEASRQMFEEISSSLDSYDDDQMKDAVSRVLADIGMEAPSYDYDESLLGDSDEIERLMKESLKHLLPVATPDYDEFDELLKSMEESDKQLSEWSDDCEIDVRDTDIDIETFLGDASYNEISFADVDLSQYSEEEILTINMNDGSSVKMVVSGNSWIIIDQTSGKAWMMTLDDNGSGDIIKAKGDLINQLTKWVEKARKAYNDIKTFLDVVTVKIETEFKILHKEVMDLDKTVKQFELANIEMGERLKDLDKDLDALKKQAALGGPEEFRLRRQISQMEDTRKTIVRCLEKNTDKLYEAAERLGKKNMQYYFKKAALEQVTGVLDIVWRFSKILDWGAHGFVDYNKWNRFIASILPCKEDQAIAEALVTLSESYRDSALVGYIGSVSLTAVSGAMSTALFLMSKNPATAIATRVINIFADWLAGWVYEKGKQIYEDTRNTSRDNLNSCKKQRYALKCHQDEDPNDPNNKPDDDLPGDPEGSNRTDAGNGAEKRVAIDPAGYVYEGVHSNRVEGVQATAYYREEVEDMYGDKHLNEVLWNAEEYAQQNPLFTDAEGMYAWDVPPGEWRVKFEKDGYNTTFSEWLPVPPPQLEVNVEITQNAQPEVKEVHAYAEGVDISFDKYMDPETLTTSNIFVTANGERLAGAVEQLNAESVDPTGLDESARILVSKVRFVPEQKLSVTIGKVRLTINRGVKSYAGIPMTETYTQEIDVEKEVKEITVGDELVKVLYGGDKTVTVSVLPSEAGMGRTVRIANSSPMITTAVEEIQLDELGQGQLKLTGDMPGSAMLTFTLDQSDKTGEVKVNVLEELIEAEKPTASRASGSTLYRGEKVELKSESKGAVIYFTTDGSDPADPDGARRKYSVPVVLDQDLEVKAVAEVDGEQSEISDFNYTLKRSAMDFRPDNGWNWISHNFEEAVSPKDIAADNVKAILSQTDEVVADPKLGLVGTLTQLDAAHSYKVQAEGTAVAKRLETYAFNPASPISITSGWNWLGYPVDQEMTVAEAFANADFQAEDIIVGQDGAAQYDGENWTGTLATLKPGAGYMLQSKGELELVYNNSVVSDARSKFAAGIPYKAPWAADSRKYAKAMVIVAEVVDKYGSVADDDQWYVGAFSGSECRGVGRWIGGKVMMNVFGETDDEIMLRLINAESEKEVEMREPLAFSETVVGSVLNPYRINVDAPNGVQSIGSLADGSVAIVDGQLVAAPCDALDVYDAAGVKVISIADYDGSAISLDALMKGVHVVSVRNGDNYSYAKIMVK